MYIDKNKIFSSETISQNPSVNNNFRSEIE